MSARRPLAAPLISLLLLVGIWVEGRMFHPEAGDPDAYHARVRTLAAGLPYRIGYWVGTDEEPPQSAISMLRPNVLLARRYKHSVTRELATLMLMQCGDSRDMGGHYPPNCYPARGWILHDDETKQRRFAIGGTTVPVAIYRFTMESTLQFADILIYNFFARPDGTVGSGASEVRRQIQRRFKLLGAGQVQVVFDASMSEARRDEVFELLMTEAFPIVEAIRTGEVE